MSDFRPEVLSEVIGQNSENARYFESQRWKYIYFYIAAVAAIAVYFQSVLGKLDVSLYSIFFGDSLFCDGQLSYLMIGGLISILLSVIGVASFFHLVHSNIEYKNYIRANEWIARDLGINLRIQEYRKAKNFSDKLKVEHSAYLALPLALKVRRIMPFVFLTSFAVAIPTWFGFSCLIALLNHHLKPDGIEHNHTLISIPIIIAIAFMSGLLYMSNKFNKQAEQILEIRDPKEQPL